MTEFKPIPMQKVFTITLLTGFLALLLFSQVIANPSQQRDTSDTNDFGVPSPGNQETDPAELQALDDSEVSVVSKKDTMKYYFLVSASSVFTSALVGLITLFAFVFYINANDIKEFITNAFLLNGLETDIGSYGKKSAFFSKDGQIQSEIELFGFQKVRVKFTLPFSESVDPREFGLRKEPNSVSTVCDVELLPLKLRVVSEYLKELRNKKILA